MANRAQITSRGVGSEVGWKAALRGDRAAFQATVAPYLEELVEAARRELGYRVALGNFGADDLTAEELAGEVLLRAWQDRYRRPAYLGVKAWLLALLFRVAGDLARREARLRRIPTEPLEAPVPPERIYDDDEEFWEWYQPDELTRWEDVVEAPSMTPEEVTVFDEQLTRALDPRARQAFLLSELHRVPLSETALALGLSVPQTVSLLEEARRDLGVGADRKLP
jgi:RNA polymerase sigma factor (sigma-70 family)